MVLSTGFTGAGGHDSMFVFVFVFRCIFMFVVIFKREIGHNTKKCLTHNFQRMMAMWRSSMLIFYEYSTATSLSAG